MIDQEPNEAESWQALVRDLVRTVARETDPQKRRIAALGLEAIGKSLDAQERRRLRPRLEKAREQPA